MKVIINRLQDGKIELLCVRDDGSVTRAKGVPGMGADAVPHDLIHFAVETELGFTRGVYGLVASGMDLPELLTKDWKAKFKARGEMELLWSEAITATFQADRNLLLGDGKSIRERLDELRAAEPDVPDISDAAAGRIQARLDELEAAWRTVLVGGRFETEFPGKA